MKKNFLKFCAFVVLAFTMLSAMDSNLLENIESAPKQQLVSVPKQPLVLDFSTVDGMQGSVLKIAGYLLSDGGVIKDDSHKILYSTDLTYLMLESVAAWVRLNPTDFPKLFGFFSDTSAVYKAFGQLLPKIETFEDSLSALADLEKCKKFVSYMLDKNLPILIDVLRESAPLILVPAIAIAESNEDEIIKVAELFTPKIAELLNYSYIGLSTMAQTVSSDIPNAFKKSKLLPYVLAAGAAGAFIALLRFGFLSNSSSKK